MILCVGEILIDLFIDDNKRLSLPGGAPFNVCANINSFSSKCGFFGSVGVDGEGLFLKNVATKKGINPLYLNLLKDVPTTEAIVTLRDGERTFTFNRSHNADYMLDFNQFKNIDFSIFNIVHFGSLMLSKKEGLSFFKKAVDYLKKNYHCLLSFDVNYRSDIYSNESVARDLYLNIIPLFDIIKVSEEELLFLSNENDIKKALSKLFKRDQLVALSLGSSGSVCFYRNEYISVPTFKVKPIDTTGAGDAFYSYILYALDNFYIDQLTRENIVEIFKTANAVGALTTLKKGAIDSVPTLDEVKQFMNHEKE